MIEQDKIAKQLSSQIPYRFKDVNKTECLQFHLSWWNRNTVMTSPYIIKSAANLCELTIVLFF